MLRVVYSADKYSKFGVHKIFFAFFTVLFNFVGHFKGQVIVDRLSFTYTYMGAMLDSVGHVG